jgi:hypothetical protein
MSAIILRFPFRLPFFVRVEREADAPGWLVIARDHGWSYGDFAAALAEAHDLAAGLGTTVRSSATL